MYQRYNAAMENELNKALAETFDTFRLPRYEALPDMGLYLEQTTKYINQCLEPLGCVQVTGSMIRNYVKMGLVRNPVKKQYYREHIAHLLCITILKTAIQLDHIKLMFARQKLVYSNETAYNYFCMELENILDFRFGRKTTFERIGATVSVEKTMLHSALVAVSHIIYLNACFQWVESGATLPEEA